MNPVGVSCTTPALATQICNALDTGSPLSVTCNARTWAVGVCGEDINQNPGIEITANGSVCSCNTGYTVRPCCETCGGSWGAVNGDSCSAPSQTMEVICTP